MDSYLEIARKVLSEARQPLSARQILDTAYQLQIVPRDLYGRTQHKTLQARLATDILRRRIESEFYRTGPGRFYLRAALTAGPLQRDRLDYTAPSRAAQLGRFDVLTFARSEILRLAGSTEGRLDTADVLDSCWDYRKLHEVRRQIERVALHLRVLLFNNGRLLLIHDPFVEAEESPSRIKIGFDGVVRRDDWSLFSDDEFGLCDAGIRTLVEQLSLTPAVVAQLELIVDGRSAPLLFWEQDKASADDFVAVVSFDCSRAPEISVTPGDANIYDWQPLPIKTNDLRGFDRWSVRLISEPELRAPPT